MFLARAGYEDFGRGLHGCAVPMGGWIGAGRANSEMDVM
jgi:hypothetical protein